MVLLITSVISGLFTALAIYVYYHEKHFRTVFIVARAILLSLGIAFYIVVLYMQYSAVKLLKQFVDSHSEVGSNKKIAWLHFIMTLLFFWSTAFYKACSLTIFLKELASGSVFDLSHNSPWELAAKLNKSLSSLFAFMILLYMFWRYTLQTDVELEEENQRKSSRHGVQQRQSQSLLRKKSCDSLVASKISTGGAEKKSWSESDPSNTMRSHCTNASIMADSNDNPDPKDNRI